MAAINLVQLVPHAEDLFRVDGDVARLSEIAPGRLVHHDGGVRETVTFAGGAAAEQERAHGGGLPDADGCDGGLDVGHCVVDGEACGGEGGGGRLEGGGGGGVGGSEGGAGGRVCVPAVTEPPGVLM